MHFGSQREASEALLLKMQFRTKDRRKMKPKRLNRDTKRTFWVVWLFFLSCCFELEGTLFFPSLPLESNNQKKTTSPQFVWQLLRAISLSRKNYKLIFACSYMEYFLPMSRTGFTVLVITLCISRTLAVIALYFITPYTAVRLWSRLARSRNLDALIVPFQRIHCPRDYWITLKK